MNIPVTGSPRIDFSPSHILKRRPASWLGLEAETVEFIEPQTYEYEFQAPCHMLIAPELSRRYDGETALEGLPKSNLRDLTRKLTFVPAGSRFHGWQKPSVLSRVNFFYIDPRGPLLDPELRFGATEFKPRLFFFDADLWGTALKLKAQIDRQDSSLYAEALGAVLCHELIRLNGISIEAPRRGGLALWQQKRVADFIEAQLDSRISVAEMAELVHLSPYHFSRAFKESFGVPPHRYHMSRRVEAAKNLLGGTATPVTEIALRLGFSEASSLSAGFRRLTGVSPSEYRRAFS
ncbi:MAG: AraC family transcriptional regulator [Methylovirgula sp.]